MPLGIGVGIDLATRREGVGGWTPAALGGLLLGWWSADRADLLTLAGSAVTSWKDSVAAYDAAQGLSASRPQYSATSFNGSPGVTFDAVDDELTLAGVPFPTGAGECEVWTIASQDALAADAVERNIFAYGGGASATARRCARLVSTTNRAEVRVGNGVSNGAAVSIAEYSGRHLVRHVVGTTQHSVALDAGTEVTNPLVPATGTTRTRIGASDAGAAGGFWNGIIRDIIVTAPLTAGQKAQMEAWALPRRNP